MPSVDEFGFNSSDDLEEKVYRKYMKNWREFEARLIDSDAKIRAELQRLDALWEGRNDGGIAIPEFSAE